MYTISSSQNEIKRSLVCDGTTDCDAYIIEIKNFRPRALQREDSCSVKDNEGTLI